MGFICYTISTSCFLYSPTIRRQYALRHPASPLPTVPFNDVVFGAHAVILVALTYSQFFSRLWGFEGSSHQRATRPVLGVLWGSIVGVTSITVVVLSHSGWTNQDPLDWAWIDVVSEIRSLSGSRIMPCAYYLICSCTHWVMSNSSLRSSNTFLKPSSTTSANRPRVGASSRFCLILLEVYSPSHSSSWTRVLVAIGVVSRAIR